jgi:hypothetical protein
VDEDLAPLVVREEAEALVGVEPLHLASRHVEVLARSRSEFSA